MTPELTTVVSHQKYGGWSIKQLQQILGVAETKVSQSIAPWLEKAAKMWIADPERFLLMVMSAAREMDVAEQNRFESELPRRSRMLSGAANKSDLNPTLF